MHGSMLLYKCIFNLSLILTSWRKLDNELFSRNCGLIETKAITVFNVHHYALKISKLIILGSSGWKWLLVSVNQRLMRLRTAVGQWVFWTGLCRHQLISINLPGSSDQSWCNSCSEPVIERASQPGPRHLHMIFSTPALQSVKSKLRHSIRN